MNFLEYWRESIKMLRWNKFKPLLLDSIKTMRNSLILAMKYYWWLPVIFICLFYFLDTVSPKSCVLTPFLSKGLADAIFMTGAIAVLLFFILGLAKWIFTLYLTTRPTTETKERPYFRTHSNKFWKYFSTLFIPSLILVALYHNFKILTIVLAPLHWSLNIGMFFFLDSDQKIIGALKKGFRFVFYFFPLCIVINTPVIIDSLLKIGLDKKKMLALYPVLKTPGVELLSSIFSLVLLPVISLSLSATLYAKIKNKHPELF